jgi:hypothetical protein
MRSWSTLQPGESLSCTGCHEPKNQTPSTKGEPSIAMLMGPRDLIPFRKETKGFSFREEVQPILDKHCISCHNDRKGLPEPAGLDAKLLKRLAENTPDKKRAFSLLDAGNPDRSAGKVWTDSYLALTNARAGNGSSGRPNAMVSWVSAQSSPPMLEPYHAGSARSALMKLLEEGHEGVKLSPDELKTIACWIDLLVPFCGDYNQENCWNERDVKKYNHYLEKRRRLEQLDRENIQAFVRDTH